MNDMACEPPVSNREIMLGMFAAVAAVGSGAMLAALAIYPLLILSAFFFIIAWSTILVIPLVIVVGENPGVLGRAVASMVTFVFTNVFNPVAHTVYNFIAPPQ